MNVADVLISLCYLNDHTPHLGTAPPTSTFLLSIVPCALLTAPSTNQHIPAPYRLLCTAYCSLRQPAHSCSLSSPVHYLLLPPPTSTFLLPNRPLCTPPQHLPATDGCCFRWPNTISENKLQLSWGEKPSPRHNRKSQSSSPKQTINSVNTTRNRIAKHQVLVRRDLATSERVEVQRVFQRAVSCDVM